MRGHCPRRKRKRPELSRCLSSACRLPTTCLPVTYYHLSLCRLPTGCLPVTCLPPACHLPTTCLPATYLPPACHLSTICLCHIPTIYHLSTYQLSVINYLSPVIYQLSINHLSVCPSFVYHLSLHPLSLSLPPAPTHRARTQQKAAVRRPGSTPSPAPGRTHLDLGLPASSL